MSKKDKDILDEEKVVQENETLEQDQSKESEKSTDPVDELKVEIEKEKERYLRLFAEFENYKKRTTRERIEMFKTAGEDIMKSLLPVLDDFERALKEIEKSEDDGLFTGVKLINN